jgi:hypothetical protein
MTVLMDNTPPIEESECPIADKESMRLVLTAIRYDLSLDPTKTEKQIRKRLIDFATAVHHTARSLMTTPVRLTVSAAVEGESALVQYLSQIGLSKQTKAQIKTNRNTVLRYARRFGFSPASFSLLDAWEPILAVLRPAYAAATAVVKNAIERKLHPSNFSLANLDAWANAALDAGRGHAYIRQARWAFLAAIRKAGIQSRLPQLDLAVRQLQHQLMVCASMITAPPNAPGCDRPRLEADQPGVFGRALERHLKPKEVAKLWGKDESTIRKIFRDEPGVLCFKSMNRAKVTRRYVSLSIPESIVVRVHQRLENKENNKSKVHTRKNRASQNANASAREHSVIGSDEKWDREALRTAQKLRNRIQSRNK